jgi:MFS family permease
MGSELNNSKKAWSVLIVSTLAFTTCFMVWMMFGVIGIPIKKALNLNSTQFGLLTAVPVLTGSLIRVPLGIWTDKYGGRIVMAILMAITVPAIWLMSYATAYWHFLTIGLFVGWRAVRSRWAHPMWRAGSPRAARAWPWGSMAPATPAQRSTSSSRRCCWWASAGPWCRRCTPPSCWAP